MQRKEKILQILESTDNQIIDFMNKASKYRENNLITYSKNIFIPLTEICKNDCGYCNFKKTPDDPSAIILKTKEEVLAKKLKDMGAVKLYLHLEKMLMKKNQYSKN